MVFTDKKGDAAEALMNALSGVDYVVRLERELKSATSRNAVALSSADAAIHTALVLCGAGDGDYAFVPSYTFCSYVASVAHVGCVPVFLDCDPTTRCVSHAALETALLWAELQNKPPKAVVIDNAFGSVADYDVLLPLCKAHGVPVIELACDAYFAEYKGRRCGANGDYGVIAFDKRLPGGGGALLLGEDMHAARAFARYEPTNGENHDYRMSNYIAALDCAQAGAAKRLQKKCKANLDAVSAATDCVLPPMSGDAAYYAFCRAGACAKQLADAGFDVKKPPPVHTMPQYSQSKFFEHEQGYSVCSEFFATRCLIGMDISPLARRRLISILNHTFTDGRN